MNKDRVSAQDIIDALAAKADVTKHLAEDFFKAFILAIEEVLLANDLVKIKNFGTFKLNWIAPRKSVNVQTGEDILIDGYYKVIFAPDKDLKELVNKPFSHLETVVLDEENTAEAEKKSEEINPLTSLSEQANEIKGLLSEIQMLSENKKEKEPQKEKLIMTETSKKEPENPEKTTIINVEEIHFAPEKKKRTWLWVLFVILLFLAIGAAFYFFCMPVQHWVNKNFFGHDTAVYDASREEWAKGEEAIVADEFQKVFDNRLDKYEILATEKLRRGSRLAYLAAKHYGSPYFWVYIYEINTDRVSDPDKIQSGTLILVPKLDPLLIDLNNPQVMEKALELREKYLK